MEINPQFLLLVPVVVGLVQAMKVADILPSRFAVLAAIGFGILGVITLGSFSGANVIDGIVVGLTAAGLYSGTRATLNI